jgi:hypothetical protein
MPQSRMRHSIWQGSCTFRRVWAIGATGGYNTVVWPANTFRPARSGEWQGQDKARHKVRNPPHLPWPCGYKMLLLSNCRISASKIAGYHCRSSSPATRPPSRLVLYFRHRHRHARRSFAAEGRRIGSRLTGRLASRQITRPHRLRPAGPTGWSAACRGELFLFATRPGRCARSVEAAEDHPRATRDAGSLTLCSGLHFFPPGSLARRS